MLHNRQSISAPKLVVRPHVPWYRRLLMSFVGVLLIALLAYGMYVIGQSTAQPAGNITVTADPVLEQILESNSCLENTILRFVRSLRSLSDSCRSVMLLVRTW